MAIRVKSFNELGNALKSVRRQNQAQKINELINSAESGSIQALEDLRSIGLDRIPRERKEAVSAAYYDAAKMCVSRLNFVEAERCLGNARQLKRLWLYDDRFRLAQEALRPSSIEWRASLVQLKSDLGMPCPKEVCDCTSHFQVAICRHALDRNYSHDDLLGDFRYSDLIETHTVGLYFSRTWRNRWTHWLKELKDPSRVEPERRSSLIGSLGNITADFIADKTPLLSKVDAIVPVPPDPEKFVRRNLMAPTDELAKVIGKRLALPCVRALTRHGSGTRSASWDVLESQFRVDEKRAVHLAGFTVLLLEDIRTQGRTIPICAGKLQSAGVKEVVAVALGETTW